MFKKIIPTLALAFSVALVSCGGSSEDPTPAPTPTPPAGGGTVAGKFTKNVLIEDYTGTWCGYCPRVAHAIDQVFAQNISAVAVAIHRGNDPYNFADASVLEAQIGLQGYPTAMLNRKTTWNSPEPSYINQVKNLTGTDANLGIAMKPSINNGNLNLDVKVKFASDMSGLKLVVYLLENDLIYNQSNYTSYYGGASTLVGFEHDNVLRASLTNILGDSMTGTTTAGTVWTKNFSLAIPTNISNSSKLSFVAFVMDYNGKVVNVRKANLNDDQSFQES